MHVIHVMHDACNACTATLLLNYLRRSDIRHGCCSRPLPDKSGMEAALQFLAAFPDASSWHVTILSPDKRCIINKPAVGTDEFRQALPAWLQLHDVHFFVRPLLSRLIFLDLDKFAGRWTELVELQPRVITETSPGNYQWWATLSESLPLKNAGIATKQLQVVFGSDPHSTGPQQQGRLPGSLNAKVGKQCSVRVLHQCVTDISNEVLLRLTPKTQLRVDGGSVTAAERPPQLPFAAAGVDRSREDWKLACQYFETNPGASIEEASAFLRGRPPFMTMCHAKKLGFKLS